MHQRIESPQLQRYGADLMQRKCRRKNSLFDETVNADVTFAWIAEFRLSKDLLRDANPLSDRKVEFTIDRVLCSETGTVATLQMYV